MSKIVLIFLGLVTLLGAVALASNPEPKDTFVHAPFSNIISSENNPVAAYIPDSVVNGYQIPEEYYRPYVPTNSMTSGGNDGDDDDDDNDDDN